MTLIIEDGTGKLITNDAESYRYLAESIRMHPNQETLKSTMPEVMLW